MKTELQYHLKNFRYYGSPNGKKENFDFRHYSLRSTIDRKFALLKNTWKILKNIIPQVSIQRQIDIIISCCVLYNFNGMHERGLPILSRQTNIETILNVRLYNDQNKQTMNECRNVIVNMI